MHSWRVGLYCRAAMPSRHTLINFPQPTHAIVGRGSTTFRKAAGAVSPVGRRHLERRQDFNPPAKASLPANRDVVAGSFRADDRTDTRETAASVGGTAHVAGTSRTRPIVNEVKPTIAKASGLAKPQANGARKWRSWAGS